MIFLEGGFDAVQSAGYSYIYARGDRSYLATSDWEYTDRQNTEVKYETFMMINTSLSGISKPFGYFMQEAHSAIAKNMMVSVRCVKND